MKAKDLYAAVMKDYPDVMTISQMCEILGISTKTGYKLLKEGRIAAMKVGRAYRIPKLHLLDYLNMIKEDRVS